MKDKRAALSDKSGCCLTLTVHTDGPVSLGMVSVFALPAGVGRGRGTPVLSAAVTIAMVTLPNCTARLTLAVTDVCTPGRVFSFSGPPLLHSQSVKSWLRVSSVTCTDALFSVSSVTCTDALFSVSSVTCADALFFKRWALK